MTDDSLPARMDRLAGTISRRESDWRSGRLVYQVFVDRFAPPANLEAKQHLYEKPRMLRTWSQTPAKGRYDPDLGLTQGELEFWGGDLPSLRERIDHIQSLGVTTLYLNPVFEAFSNHKYDTGDYLAVDPQYGTHTDLRGLAEDLHRRGMRLVLDGVFNHMGRRSRLFEEASAAEDSPRRSWFIFDPELPRGYRSWRKVPNLPELNLENEEVRRYLWASPEAVVPWYIREIGIDGWRLDVAPELGPRWLREIRDATHAARADGVVLGECWNFPGNWLEVMDGVLNMHARAIIIHMMEGKMSPRVATDSLARMCAECDYEGLLRSHLILDNHDTPRLKTLLTERPGRQVAMVLQFTLPGCPVIYYGTEIGMPGGFDPTNRAPMRWDHLHEENPDQTFLRKLISVRQENRALSVGEFAPLDTDGLIGYLRTTHRAVDTVVVLVNPSARAVSSVVSLPASRLMDAAELVCQLTGSRVTVQCGLIQARLEPRTAWVLRPEDRGDGKGYSMFKRADHF